jgi:hypothetical protein
MASIIHYSHADSAKRCCAQMAFSSRCFKLASIRSVLDHDQQAVCCGQHRTTKHSARVHSEWQRVHGVFWQNKNKPCTSSCARRCTNTAKLAVNTKLTWHACFTVSVNTGLATSHNSNCRFSEECSATPRWSGDPCTLAVTNSSSGASHSAADATGCAERANNSSSSCRFSTNIEIQHNSCSRSSVKGVATSTAW